MGCNYYLVPKRCPTCGHAETKKHIGKSSVGWQFHFRGYHAEYLVSYKEWLNHLSDEKKEIIDEYGKTVSLEEFKALVEVKKVHMSNYNIVMAVPMTEKEKEYCRENNIIMPRNYDYRHWKDDEGHSFTDHEFC